MPDDCLFDDPEELTGCPDVDDLRWGLAVPEGWRHRDRRPMTDAELKPYIARLNRKYTNQGVTK